MLFPADLDATDQGAVLVEHRKSTDIMFRQKLQYRDEPLRHLGPSHRERASSRSTIVSVLWFNGVVAVAAFAAWKIIAFVAAGQFLAAFRGNARCRDRLGRYAEIFAYDDQAETFSLEDPKGYLLMQQGRGGMGSRKHGKSGHASRSPRFRLWARLEAERTPEPRRPQAKLSSSVSELFSRGKRR